MAKLKKWHIAAIVISSILVVLGATALTIWAVIYRDQPEEVPYVYGELTNFEPLEWKIGDKFYSGESRVNTTNCADLFGKKHEEGATYTSKNTNIIAISGNTVTVKGIGKVTLIKQMGDVKTEYDAKVIDGVNVSDYAQLKRAVNEDKLIPIQQKDMVAVVEKQSLMLTTNFYGNAYKIVRESTWDIKELYLNTFIEVMRIDVVIQDAYIIGKEVEDGTSVVLSEMGVGGVLISFNGDTVLRPTGAIINCVLENAHRGVFLNVTDVRIEGCFIRNVSDACVSIETTNDSNSNITMKNNVIMNATVAAVLFWCGSNNTNESNFINFVVEGFLDIYNWTERYNARIIPDSEGALASFANPLISSEIKQAKYNSYFYKYKGKEYVHCGFIVISTAGRNEPNITLPKSYRKRNFPLPSFANTVIKVCDVYGYVSNPEIQPDAAPNLATLFDELRNGRKDK